MTRVGNTNRFVPIDEDARFEGGPGFPYYLGFPVHQLVYWQFDSYYMWPEKAVDELTHLEEGRKVAHWQRYLSGPFAVLGHD